jgi:Na+-transporting NADH:ubiquinone oxidoreductase subunit NqrB
VEVTFPAQGLLSAARALLPRDARIFQIVFLALLLTVGVLLRDFSLQPLQMALAFAAGLATQAFWLQRLGLEQRGFLSAIVTCCGLSLLLRSDAMWAHPLAATLAMSSKFLLRVRGKHLYNPANLGVIAAITLLPGTWVSPGQWGNDLALAVWLLMLGTIVTTRARRLDISWVFLGAFLGLVALRIMLLGQSWAIWWHQLGNGALLLFAFFMISDPMTIPNRRGPRIVYALIVAAGAIGWQYLLFRPNALIWALFLATPLVPLLDRLFPGQGFSWRGRGSNPLRACGTSCIPPQAAAEDSPAPARSATTALSSFPVLPSPTSGAPSIRRARPAARVR